MGYQKQFQEGPVTVTVAEDGGDVSIAASASASIGSGSLKDMVSVQSQNTIKLRSVVVLDAGLAVAAQKFPSLAAEIALIKGALDAELAKA